MKIILLGQTPAQKNSKRAVYNSKLGRVVVYTAKRVKDWQDSARLQLVSCDRIEGPVEVSMKFWNKDRHPRDIDNMQTSVFDVLKGAIIEDDNCFVLRKISAEFVGVDKLNPRVEIDINKFVQ